MRDLVLDLTEYSVRAALLLYLCRDIIPLKEKYRSVGKILFFLQAFLVSFVLSYFQVINRLFGDEANMQSVSSRSLVSILLIFLVSFAAMDILYQGSRLAKFYLLSVYHTVKEMVRFALHTVWLFCTNACYVRLYEKASAGEMDPENFMRYADWIQFWGMLIFSAATAVCMYAVFRLFRRCQTGPVTEMSREGLRFLLLIPIIGMVLSAAWRVLFYYQKGTEIEFLYDRHVSMYVVIPLVSVLCLAGIVLSGRIYAELMQAEAQKNGLLFYKQQLTDMTEHVRELEQLYDGIRGMRHDINNCVADMEQLLVSGTDSGELSAQTEREARRYLRDMRQAADSLSLRFSTGNPVTDVILNRKYQICIQEHIALDGELLYPSGLAIEAFDLGIVLNNALDNAIEACRRLPGDAVRRIGFRSYVKGRMFFLVVENTYDRASVRFRDGRPVTAKADAELHGLGMRNIRNCVEKYYGTMQYEAGEEQFVLTLMLQGRDGS